MTAQVEHVLTARHWAASRPKQASLPPTVTLPHPPRSIHHQGQACGPWWQATCAERFGQAPVRVLPEWNTVAHRGDTR